MQRLIDLALEHDFGKAVASKCMREETNEHNKAEFPYLLEPLDPESVRGGSLNGDDKLALAGSRRLRKFGRALRRANAKALHQLS